MRIVQRGYNPKFPDTIDIWRLGDDIPEWLSDRAKVSFVDGDGNITLESLNTSTGGLEIQASDGSGVLVSMESRLSYVCYSKGFSIFSLTPKQFELLYEVKKK